MIEMTKLHAMIAITVLLSGAAAAQPADIPAAGMTPGDLFYGLERASEALELAVASAPVIGSDELAAKVRANHAAERLAEARKLAEKNKTEKVEQLMDQYSRGMNRSVQTAKRSGKPEFVSRLKNVSSNQVKVLEQVKQQVPGPAKKGIENAIENSRKNQEELELPEQARKRPGTETGNRDRSRENGINISVGEKPSTGRPGKERPGPGERPGNPPEPEKPDESGATTGSTVTGQAPGEVNDSASTGGNASPRQDAQQTPEVAENASVAGLQ
ncbi:MAG: DUF5667 domain-containing protein [Candidatus Nanohaloarchaea archaeon]